MLRPVWLFSRNTDRFRAPPLTTGGLAAHHARHGATAGATEIELVHFLGPEDLATWLAHDWPRRVRPHAEAAVAAGLEPVFGFSCYTWNVADFLDLARLVRQTAPGALIVAGGPHAQRPETTLAGEPVDVVVLGEGERTFTELLDHPRERWPSVAGLALARDGGFEATAERPRATDLDALPSALDVVPLRDEEGRPLYGQVAYETSRGCPYRCAFCEWGTGAIGTKMHQVSLERMRRDVERLVEGGVTDLWLCDSNFGALREDPAKAELVVDVRRRTGLPRTFATSWSKNHNARVQGIVRTLHREGLLPHYHLALQTLTPRALETCHRTNMRANDYEPVVRALAAEGVPVAAELIWPLPGDTLGEFETNLDHLLTVFPNVNIFGYTLLPGTEFHDRREELALETRPVAGYDQTKGEYVVGCQTFDREEGEEGYFLVTAYVLLARGQILPRTLRDLALRAACSVSTLARALLRDLLVAVGEPIDDRIAVYERRAEIYVALLEDPERTYAALETALERHLPPGASARARALASLDRALAPRTGPRRAERIAFAWDAKAADTALARMEAPAPGIVEPGPIREIVVEHPGGVGEVLLDPDGGEWMKGRMLAVEAGPEDRPRAG